MTKIRFLHLYIYILLVIIKYYNLFPLGHNCTYCTYTNLN